MKKRYLLLIIFIALYNSNTKACGCTTDGPFLEVSTNATLIAVVEIKNYLSYEELMDEDVPMSMTVSVKRVLKGTESRNEIIVWGNNGIMCSPYLSLFDIGTTWVIAFKIAPTEGHRNAKIDDYGISNCGEHFFPVKEGTISGLINGGNSYQSMSISTLKKNLDIINREENRIDKDKCSLIQQLTQTGIDTIGVFEDYYVNQIIPISKLTVTFQMSIDDIFPEFCDYIKNTTINRQVFVYWKSNGKTYIKQIDNLFSYEALEINESAFFDTFLVNKTQITSERLQLPTKRKQRRRNKKRHQKSLKKPIKQPVNWSAFRTKKKGKEAYLLQSFQLFIDDEVILRDFDTRLFKKSYNRKFYKKNKKMLTYNWLQSTIEEVQSVIAINQKSKNLFKQYKRLMVVY